MKKNYDLRVHTHPTLKKLIMELKIVILIVLLSVTNIFASNTYSQTAKVTLNAENKTLEQVMDEIEQRSEFYFIFNQKQIDVERIVNIQVENKLIDEILPELFTGTDINYTVLDRKILLTTETIDDDFTILQSDPVLQQNIVTGTVTDASTGNPMPGVNIVLKGTTLGALTDVNGRYTLAVPEPQSAILVFSFIGFGSKEVPVTGKSIIDTTLEGIITGLEEVVVIGYGTMKKKDLTGSVASVKTEQLASEKPQNIQDILRGNVAGLAVGFNITAKGGGDIEIRGKNTLKTSSFPLIVLDGVIYPGDISDINPYDIESMEVLKDASSAAVFGAKAANGVILVTTKKGSIGKPIINFTSSVGISTIATMPELYGPYDFVAWRQDVMRSANYYNPNMSTKLYKFDNPENLPDGISMDMWMDGAVGDPSDIWLSRLGLLDIEKNNYRAGKSIDWADMVFQSGIRQDYNLSISGKKEEFNYYWSLGYNKNEAIIVGDEFATIRSRLNLDSKINNWLTLGLNSQYSNRDESSIPVSWSVISINSPWGSFYYDDGVTMRPYPTEDIGNSAANPLYSSAFQDRRVTYNTFINNLYAELRLPLGISYKITFAPRFEWYEYMNHQSALHEAWALFGGQADRRQQETFSWQVDNLIKWNKTINDIHQFDLTFLVNAEKFQSWENRMRIQGFSPTDILGYHSMTAGSNTTTVISSDDQYSTGDALMARMFYSLMSRYMLTLTVRQDGYSAFGLKHPRGIFPSAALGWVFSEENFLKNDILTFGKLRFSWGENGNREVGRYVALSDMGLSKYAYQTLAGTTTEKNILYINTMQNSDLRWEKTRAINLGVDFEIKNGLLGGSLEFYDQKTMDLLVDRSLPDITGVESVTSNLGQVDNKGFELNLNARIMNKVNLKWLTNFTFSLNRNKIVHLYGDMVDILDENGDVIGQKEGDDLTNRWFIGHAIDEIWDPVVIGIWQIGEEEEAAQYGQHPGDFRIKDVDNSGNINYLDHEFQGFKTPRFRWYLRNDFNIFKYFDFSFTMYSYWGHYDTFNSAKNKDKLYPDRSSSYITPYWTPEKPSNTWARIYSSDAGIVFSVYREKSFIRFDNLTLSFSVPNTLLNKVKISSLKLYGTIRNVGWWAPHWELTDPEKEKSSSWTVADADNYGPSPRYFTLGINLTL